MAQTKREQINIVGKGIAVSKTEVNTVPDLLLQRHRLLVVRGIATRLSFRLFFMLVAAGLTFMPRFSITHLVTSAIVALLCSYIWRSERKFTAGRLRGVESILAQRSGDDWQDTYIIFRNQRSDDAGRYSSSYEPFIWPVLVVLLATWRFISMKLGL
jgi:hypothetical protein